jgi:hypothetical protein
VPSSGPIGDPVPDRGGAYDYLGPVHWEYSPVLDRDADPGEVVWAWVSYEEESHVGKDRPMVIVGRTDDHRLVALMLSSRDHGGDSGWISAGTGSWDKDGRESWVRLDRLLAVEPAAVRREGAILPKDRFDRVVLGVRVPAVPPVPKRKGVISRLRGLLRR